MFVNHPGIGKTIVVIDSKTDDDTERIAKESGATVVTGDALYGKGSCVANGLQLVGTRRVVFCDTDLTGLTPAHISGLIYPLPDDPMVIGVPDFPEWQTIPPSFAKQHFVNSWPWVSGERCVPTEMARRLPLYGYLMETQLNIAAHTTNRRIVFERLPGLVSKLDLNPRRLADMHRQLAIGRRLGYV